ncbi:pyruvate kinase [Undibacterium arcticum]
MPKIIATLGPASSDAETIQKLFEAGADVFRFNFSHGSHQDHQARHEIVREVERKTWPPDRDSGGPAGTKNCASVRLPKAGSRWRRGAEFVLDRDAAPGTIQRVCLPHPELFEVITVGQSLLLDDGKLRLQVLASDGQRIRTRVITGGPLSDRKGVNVPDAVLPIPVLTEKGPARSGLCLGIGCRVGRLVLRAASGRFAGGA